MARLLLEYEIKLKMRLHLLCPGHIDIYDILKLLMAKMC